ncbi:MFS general substrate transporter [Pluteus cervinus]|uniref:MFS general substrate transporter n=1 Tax=Pluteus cervinus TaxID=181527 RepID=A0ACD3AF24_9AGAR|nr:MFS general substrate transporter [Pluteus cervinus]
MALASTLIEKDILALDTDEKNTTVTTGGALNSSSEIHPSGTTGPVVTRRELWAYYLYYSGDNGIGPFGYSLTLFQGLITTAGYDPIQGPGSSCLAEGNSGQCVVPWAGGTKAVSSVVLIANGVSFAVMTLIFTSMNSVADYGTLARWMFLLVTCICWGAQYASITLTKPSRWPVAMVLYMIGNISCGATLVFFAAIFPRLARHTEKTRTLRERYANEDIDRETFEREESMEKNRISNISTMYSCIGETVVLCLGLSVLLPLSDNPLVDNYTIILVNSYWVVVGIWWFIFQQPRPGPPLPKGENYLTIGWKQIWATLKEYKRLPYTFIYLFGFFLLADGLNTTLVLIFICQNATFTFSFLENTYLTLAQTLAGAAGMLGFWYIQRYWKISTKKMLVVPIIVTVLIPFWGMLGIWTDKVGFHNVWEYWAYNIVFGLLQTPFFAYSQTMMAELTPPGYENMFFALFGLSNRASSMIGPNVIQAIIDKSGSNWMAFPFLFAISLCASLIIWLGVDEQQGRRAAQAWARSNQVRN